MTDKNQLCKCGHDIKFHPEGMGGCFHTPKNDGIIMDFDDEICSCEKFEPKTTKKGYTNSK